MALCIWGIYQAITHAYDETINRGLESIAGELKSSIEPVLQQPGVLPKTTPQLLLKNCTSQISCSKNKTTSKIAPIIYVRLLDHTGRIIAQADFNPKQLPFALGEHKWETITDKTGRRYRQLSLLLHTQDKQPWGYLHVGRSLDDRDQHIANLRLILFLGWPFSMLLLGISSWWLAGLAMQPVQQSYRQMQQFTADAAHEFRTPLAAMQLTTESALKLDYLSEAETREILQTIQRQNTRLSQLVRDLLLLARMDKPGTRQCSLCSLNDLVNDLVEELADMATEANVSLSCQVFVQQPLHIHGNSEELYRMISNLVVNAIHYTPPRGKVLVTLNYCDPNAVIQVRDTGIGIAPEDRVRIFDRFYRVDRNRSRHTGGSGLGLSIAQAIATTHHGSIQVQSQLGLGSTFTVRLPVG